ncbi:MAG: hypothetical protein KGL39_40735 [Patescibacteria group bacterium]|nr:hypothetical protein [Patescibacteria group bacterium]
MPQANNRCCPKCVESGIEVPTLSDFSFRDSEGHMEIRCPNGHRFFADDPSVMRAPALKGGIPPEYLPAQPGVELETVSLNKTLVTAAKQRFGHGVRAALESLLSQAMTGGFWLDGETIEALRPALGAAPASGSELKGRVTTAMAEAAAAKKLALESVKAPAEGPITANALMVPLSKEALSGLDSICAGNNRNRSQYVGEFLEGAIKNGWL